MTNANTKTVTYGTNELEVAANLSVQEVKASLAQIFPEITNASYEVDPEGNITFTVKSGTKGAKVIYGSNELDVADNLSVEEIKASLSQIFPEITNASYEVASNGDVTFTVKSGTKGAKVIYGSNELDVADNLSVEEIKASLSQIFPEITNASYEVASNGDVTFTVKSGTKGAKVIYGSNELDVADNLSVDEIKASLSQIFPEISNASYEVASNGDVTFTVKSGTKGAKVIYGSNELDVADNLSIPEIKASLSQIFPEIANASYEVNGETGDVTFTVKSGTKGAKVIYGSNELDVADNLSIPEIKASLSQIFPEIANASYEVNGETGDVTFTVKSGTKGAKVIYGSNELDVADNLSVDEIKASLSQIFPEISNASYEVSSNGDVTFTVKSGTKGAKVTYGSNELDVADNLSVEEIKASLAQIFPEITNASYEVASNGDVTFTVKSGTKGAKVIYGSNELDVADNLSVDEIKASLSQIFPEISNASYEVASNGDVTFTVKSGTKGLSILIKK